MKLLDTNIRKHYAEKPNHLYVSNRREPGKNHIIGDAYRNILEFIRETDKDRSYRHEKR